MQQIPNDQQEETSSPHWMSKVSTFFTKQTIDRVVLALLAWFESSTPRFQPVILVIALISFIATVVLLLTPTISQDPQVANITSVPGIQKPNIILILVDALSAEDMSLFGYNVETTPNLEKITQDWSVYADAQSTGTCSIDIYPAIITGRYPGPLVQYNEVGDNIRASDKWVNLFEILHKVGYQTWWSGFKPPGLYHTGAGIDNIFARPNNEVLPVTWIQMGGVRKTYFPYIPLYFNEIAHALQKKEPQGSMLDVASSLIAQKTMQSPFFMYVHYHGAHGVPYQAGQFLGSLLPKTSGLLDAKSQGKYYGRYQLKNQPMVDMLRLRYDEGVLNQDNTLKALIDTIKNAGYYDSSMIIITADHVQVFNNGYSSHCTPLLSYSETHVPLLIKYPNETNGETIHNVISTIDLTPTILDVAGVKYQQDWFDGISLLNNLPGPNSDPYVFAYQSGDLSTATVMNDRYKLTERGAGKYYLFDYIKDPAEKKNLYKSLGPDSDIVKEAMAALQKFQADVKNR